MRSWIAPVIVALALAALPAVLTPYTQDLVVKIAVSAIFALSLELLVGATGLVSLGHAAFLGIGAYVDGAGHRRRAARPRCCGCCRPRWARRRCTPSSSAR